MDPLNPPATVLAKVGSVVRHLQEAMGDTGMALDVAVAERLLEDPELEAWLEEMDKLGLIPAMR